MKERACLHCGRSFTSTNRGRQKYCDNTCRYAAQTGVSREEYIRDWEKGNSLTQRRCHDCGRPTNDYRCPSCWAKKRSETELSGIPEYEFHGKSEGHAWL